MDESSALITTFRGLLFFLGAFGLPQVCGVLSLHFARRIQRKITLVPALFVSPAIFFTTAYVFWGMQADPIRVENHYIDGILIDAAAYFSTICGTAVHLGISSAVLFFMWLAVKRRNHFLEERLLPESEIREQQVNEKRTNLIHHPTSNTPVTFSILLSV